MDNSRPALGSLIPLLWVYDVGRSVAYYRDVLGFELERKFEGDGQLYWAQLKCGEVRIMLNAEFEAQDRRPEHDRRRSEDVSFYFYPADIAALRGAVASRGGKPTDFHVTFYRHKQFSVRDPDGYTLCFSQETNEAPDEKG